MDDLTPPKIKITKPSRAIFPVAAEDPKLGKYFKSVIKIARAKEKIDKEKILDYLKQIQIEPGKEDINDFRIAKEHKKRNHRHD